MAVFIDTPQFPNVPLGPGVPPLVRSPGQVILGAVALLGDALGIFGQFLGPQWGIFDDGGSPVAIPDSVISVDVRRDARISDYPVEQGGFASYNKVQLPLDTRVRFAVSTDRAGFLQDIDNAWLSLDLYTVVTPDASYSSANIVHYDYTRHQRSGVSMFIIDIWLEEVRESGTTQFANNSTRTPAGAQQSNGGTVSPTAPTTSMNTPGISSVLT